MVTEKSGVGSDQIVIGKIKEIINTPGVTRRAIYDETTISWEVRKGLLLMCGLDGLDGLDAPEKQTMASVLAAQVVEPGDLNRENPQVELGTLLQKKLVKDQKNTIRCFL